MARNPAKTTLIGIILGLWLAASAALINMIQEGANEAFQSAAAFISDLPTLLFIGQVGMPAEWQVQVLFIYCAVVGATLGWLKGMARPLFWIAFMLVFTAVMVSHWLPELAIEQGVPAAFDYASHVLLIGR